MFAGFAVATNGYSQVVLEVEEDEENVRGKNEEKQEKKMDKKNEEEKGIERQHEEEYK